MATIRLQDVTKVFPKPQGRRDLPDQEGSVVALDHVNLTVPDGQTFAVVGPSGCGKTTLLRVVAGLEVEFAGCVFFDDEDVTDVPPRDRYIGMVFQNYALYPHFKSRGNLSFYFRVRKAPAEEEEERIRITSEMMGIGFKELLRHKPGTLSGGERQRVAIARAIVRKPRLFLFDEPLSNLDAKLRAQTRVEIKRLLHQFQITALYVTHDQVEAIALSDQLAIMRQGRIEQVGPYLEVLQNPVNAFVAGFLGRPPMNMLTGGTVVDGALRLGEVTVALPDAVKAQVSVGQSLTLGVRPESAILVSGGQSPPEGIHLRGEVEVIEPDFGRRIQMVYVRTGELAYAASGSLDVSLDIGAEVAVVFPTEQLYFFDGENEQRIG
ncbi:MAG: ABC transporter ATP-binding protein [Anaerolineae bacterium]|nr:ABC transporter ATP-binding protein [Anaerolineae bacterium]